jgi:hypothetical protein
MLYPTGSVFYIAKTTAPAGRESSCGIMNEYGGVGPWIFLYIQYIFSRLGQYVKLCIMQQRETEK